MWEKMAGACVGFLRRFVSTRNAVGDCLLLNP